jgi:DNA repair exonuclease SbcCD ATPase subunit
MHVRKVTLQNYMRHDNTVVELPSAGVVLVTGENGSGKSGIAEATATACWGKTLRGTTPWRPKQPGVAEVELEDGLRIRRSRSKGGGTELELFGDVERRDTTTTKTQERLESVVGDFDTWRRTSVFSSSDAAAFTGATDAERKRLIETLLNMDRFEVALKACRVDVKPVRDKVQHLGQLKLVLTDRLATLRQKRRELDETVLVSPDVSTPFDTDKQRERINKLFGLTDECRIELKTKRQEVAAARDKAQHAKFMAEQTEKDAHLLHAETCPMCKQALPDDLIAPLRSKVAEARNAARRAAKNASTKQTELSSEINDLEEEYEALQARHQEEVGVLRDHDRAMQRADQAAEQAERLEQMRRSTIAQIKKAKAELAQVEADVVAVAEELAELEAVDRVLSYEGVRAHVLGKALGGIEAVANNWLSRIADHDGWGA